MADEEGFKCEICGREFDSQRGLSIHQTQSHDEEIQDDSSDNVETENQKSSSGGNPSTISVSTRQALLVVFALGLAIGFSAGLAASGFKFDSDTDDISSTSTIGAIKNIADSTGLDGGEVVKCIESSDDSETKQDRSEINQITGGIGTPTFFIGNSQIGYTEISGSLPYSRMKPAIDQKILQAKQGNTTIGSDERALKDISFEGEPVMGEESAPINIIEYSDYGCPWCAEWHGFDAVPQRPIDQEDSFNQVKSNYVDTGDVQFVLKDYPVSRLHPDAETAHKAANCVLENSPDKFWELSQKLYEERDRWQS